MDSSTNYLQLFKDGEARGLTFVITQFGDALRFFAFSMVKRKEIAEEIVGDVFIKSWDRRERADDMDGLKAFLYIATRNACVDYLRTQRRSPFEERDLAQLDCPSDEDILAHITYVELLETLRKHIDTLPAQQAAVVRFTYLEGLETDEICTRLNTSSGNVYYARSKAVATLRKLFLRSHQLSSLHNAAFQISAWSSCLIFL